MDGWNDPIDPDRAHRRPAGQPDQPGAEPWYDAVHHSYDPSGRYPYREPEQPGYDADRSSEPADDRWPGTYPQGDDPYGRSDRHDPDATGRTAVYRAPGETAGYAAAGGYGGYGDGRYAEGDRAAETDRNAGWGARADAWQSLATGGDQAEEPAKRRLPRPALLAGAAATATLAVMVGVGAMTLHSGSDQQDRTVATADGGAAPATTAADDGTNLAGDPTETPAGAEPSSAAPSPRASRAQAPVQQRKAAPKPPASRATRSSGGSNLSADSSVSGPVTSQEQQVIDLVNQERAKAGCGSLAANSALMKAARLHSKDQAAHNTMSHDGSDGSQFFERIARAGYPGRSTAENVAVGYKSPAEVMDGWMHSEHHRDNILNCSYKDIGVGVARGSNGQLYWTQDFGG
ncbi:CAP domain-containing protein [Plantactinospora siamensis]|uniref:CAP domain-containing protein n=1 Tax=Plantactinospora siamensis TaxID=555372 RepID=A0ABV6NT02_9ACTN